MIKILELSASLDGGGVDRLLFDFCTRMMGEMHFDFVVTSKREGILEKELREQGAQIFHIEQMSGNFVGYLRELNNIIKHGKYDIVHDHMNQAAMGSMLVAKLNKVPVRIAHAHTCIYNEQFIRKIKRKIMVIICKSCATNLCACGERAAYWMWGRKSVKKCYLMKNAINLNDFFYSSTKREYLRKKYNMEDCFVIGNVARLAPEKNQRFLIDVFRIINNRLNNARLLFVGNGPMELELKERVNELKLKDKILFMGVRNDVSDLLNMLDVFVLPSKYEGFPVTLVEAQTNGLPVVASDRVTYESVLSKNFLYESIEANLEVWADGIIGQRNQRSFEIDSRIYEYDIDVEVERLKNFYSSTLNSLRIDQREGLIR